MWRTTALLLCCAAFAPAQDLMPLPAKMSAFDGAQPLTIDAGFRVEFTGYRESRLDDAAARLTKQLTRQTAIPIGWYGTGGNSPAVLIVDCKGAGESVQTPNENESYTLEVKAPRARLTAATPVGVLRGMATFVQLVTPKGNGFAAGPALIEDSPRFPWRGLMIDSARHFQPVEVIERNLDAMAAVKLNVFHWHLSDNQGFRVESRRYPKLHGMGSDGLYYTQDQVRHIIAYARERGIRVVPEFDMPGHTTAFFVGYPELASAPGPYRLDREWGIFDPAMDPTNEQVYKFLDGLIAEMAALFPDPYFHIGGDEVNGKQWDANPKIQEFKRAHGIKTNEELQAHFSKRVVPIVEKYGKKVIGWDEVMQPGLPKSAVIHSWRGAESLAQAARQGYQGILSNGYYVDLMFHASQHYLMDPLGGEAANLTPAQQKLILGGEACEWSEFATPEVIDARIWPRTAAIAERLWSPRDVRDVDSMYRRLAAVSNRLNYTGLKHQSAFQEMADRIAGYRASHALTNLLSIVEPVKEYQRGQMNKYFQWTPLNRAVDVARPESMTARQFGKDVDALLAGDGARRERLRRSLLAWRDQNAQLKEVFAASFLAAEIAPVSETVAEVANAGIEALDYISGDKKPPQGWAAAQNALLEKAKKPQAELLISILEPVGKLVAGAGK